MSTGQGRGEESWLTVLFRRRRTWWGRWTIGVRGRESGFEYTRYYEGRDDIGVIVRCESRIDGLPAEL